MLWLDKTTRPDTLKAQRLAFRPCPDKITMRSRRGIETFRNCDLE